MTSIRQTKTASKVSDVSARLEALAREIGPDEKLPTVRELCQLLDTSWSTLKDALDVLEKQQIIYRKQSSGIFVSPTIEQQTICILLNSLWLLQQGTSPFWASLWGLFSQEAQQRSNEVRKYTFHLFINEEKDTPLPREVMEVIQVGRVAGVLGVSLGWKAQKWLGEQQIPCVVFADWGPRMVALDGTELLRMGVASLTRQGCRRIGLWQAVSRDGTREQLLENEQLFRSLLRSHDVAYDPELSWNYVRYAGEADLTGLPTIQEQGYVIAQHVFGERESAKPDGIVINSDMLLDGALAGLQACNVQVGEDVWIATHGNTGLMLYLSRMKGITIIEYDPAEIVEGMFQMLETLLSGEQPAQSVAYILPRYRQ